MDSKCYLCGSETSRQFKKEDMNFVRCAACGLMFISPVPVKDEMEKNYGAGKSVTQDKLNPETKNKLMKRMKYRLGVVEKYAGKKGRLLDIGCGPGDFLSAAKESGWQCSGVELSKDDCAYLREGIGVEAYDKILRDVRFPGGHFDAVTLFHVIEHFSDPLSELKEINRILADGGVLCAELPNIDALVFRLKGSAWKYINPEHLFYFNKNTIRKLFEKAGFEIAFLTGISGLDWWGRMKPLKLAFHKIVTASGAGDHLIIVARKYGGK